MLILPIHPRPNIASAAATVAGSGALLAEATASPPSALASLQAFQDSHALLVSLVLGLLTRYVIGEIRYRVEKPVLDDLSSRTADALTPRPDSLSPDAWAKLALCIVLDLAGDASELIPVLGEFTDLGFAPVEAALIKALFQSNALAAIGFAEELLPFTDVFPTFTISWALSNLWPTTPLAQKLLPNKTAP
uniref:Uncharacterized protein n=1 Tax=Calcidiscus leptoporus TaxID=127549 RepID=A0A7S0IVY7_9EUKA|mmetsp:Transcript_25799/g.60231  ORF Transcript_25799/g.60231 Transcript_25799/m.60231 type:complete len:191 (+) Transcript_25799:36-608(+)